MKQKQEEVTVSIPRIDKLTKRDVDLLRARAEMEMGTYNSVEEVAPGKVIQTTHDVIEAFHSSTEGLELIFDVRGIKDAIVSKQIPFTVYKSDLTKDWYEHILEKGGIEELRIERLEPKDLRRPLIGVLFPQGWTQIIDGNHRLVKRWRVGLRTIRFVLVELHTCLSANLCCLAGDEAKMLSRGRHDGELLSASFRILNPAKGGAD